jgi:hypothetical protein
MNCREAIRRLALGSASADDAELQQHLATCAACRELAGSLANSSLPDPSRIAAIQEQLGRSLKPVRPLPPPSQQVALLAIIYGVVAVAAAALIGFSALHVLRPWQMVCYFGAFAIAAGWLASTVIERFYPGIRSRFGGASVLWATTASLAVLALLLFPNFNVAQFGSGVRCLETGCVVAVPASIVFALVLRRTLAPNPISASATVGFFAGLCGDATLALHCPVLEVMHIIVWHLGVLAVATAGGAGIGWLAQSFLLRRRVTANR